MVNIKHDLVDLTFARMQNYAEMQFGVNCKFNQVIFFEYYNKILHILCSFYYSSGRYVCFYIYKISLLTVLKKGFILYLLTFKISLSLIHIWWMLIFYFPKTWFKIKAIAVLATSWCRIWIWNFSLPPLVKASALQFFSFPKLNIDPVTMILYHVRL